MGCGQPADYDRAKDRVRHRKARRISRRRRPPRRARQRHRSDGRGGLRRRECAPGSARLTPLCRALARYDGGAQSPRETWLRLLVIDTGFPPPGPRYRVIVGGRTKYYLDMGWPDLKVAALEYEGDHHRTDRAQFARDIARPMNSSHSAGRSFG